MIVYQATKKQFLIDSSDNIADKVAYSLNEKVGISVKPGSSEYRSWQNSLGDAMHHVMNDEKIPDDSIVAIEYKIPRTKHRIDFLVTGKDLENKETCVIIELKQWDEVHATEKDGIVKTFFNGSLTETTHPSYQVWSYASLLHNFNEYVYSENVNLFPCTYLHNLKTEDQVLDSFYTGYLDKAPAFLNGQKLLLQQYISSKISSGDDTDILKHIENGNVRPSKELADSIASMLKGNQEFILIFY